MEIKFDFYDLCVIPGLFANGTAEINVRADGVKDEPEWFIGSVYLHGENNELIEVDNGEYETLDRKIYLRIYDILENQCAGKINDKVSQELLERRIEAGERRSPRELMIEGMA